MIGEGVVKSRVASEACISSEPRSTAGGLRAMHKETPELRWANPLKHCDLWDEFPLVTCASCAEITTERNAPSSLDPAGRETPPTQRTRKLEHLNSTAWFCCDTIFRQCCARAVTCKASSRRRFSGYRTSSGSLQRHTPR